MKSITSLEKSKNKLKTEFWKPSNNNPVKQQLTFDTWRENYEVKHYKISKQIKSNLILFTR